MNKQQAIGAIDQHQDTIIRVNDKIWEYAELSLMEHQSAALYCKVLDDLGFEVQSGVAEMPTAFIGRYGSGRPVIGILAEYDALSGLSQKGGSAEKSPITPGGHGHGCGHNCLGAGSLAAAVAVKAYLENNPQKSGTVIFYGCPGEEGGSGKGFMARAGIFEELDAAITWHPNSANEVTTGSNNACLLLEYKFTGVASHAAGDPHLGRSALDAVELMNLGVQFLREHMIDAARIHYAITDAGGFSPNVVQPTAQVLYMVRSPKCSQAFELLERVEDIAKGAALMTGTSVKRRFIDGTSDVIPNTTLEKVLYENYKEIGVPGYTEEEKAFAAALIATYENPRASLPGSASNYDPDIAAFVREKIKDGRPLNDFLIPHVTSEHCRMGSTDVGDVSWICPTAQIGAVTWASNSPGHSWQNVACGCTSIAHKGLINAGRVMAGAVIDLIDDPSVIDAAKVEFKKRLGGETYKCPIPADVKPTPISEPM